MNIGTFLKLGRALGFLRTAPDGNLIANVNLRTDTLVNLIALASGGGSSELGYDPVTRTLVFFNGVQGEAKPSGREIVVARHISQITSTVANADNITPTAVPFNLAGAMYTDDALVDPDGDLSEILIPAGHGITACRIHGNCKFAAGTGIARRLRIEGWNGVMWVTTAMPIFDFGNPTSPAVNAGNTAQDMHVHINLFAKFDFQAIPFTKLRITVLADAAVSVSKVAGSHLEVELLAL